MLQLRVMLFAIIAVYGCQAPAPTDENDKRTPSAVPQAQHTLTKDQTHNKFSSAIPPVLRVASGTVIEAYTEDASDEQIGMDSDTTDLDNIDFDLIHPLTGPVYVEDARPGDILKVTLHEIELGNWGWNAMVPGLGFLADTLPIKYLRLYELGPGQEFVHFNDTMRLRLKPFPGVMGVAPPNAEMLSTIPPRANGGNMDDPNMTKGAVIYFPVFVDGALFSLGDGHAVQGHGEVCGTAIEAPLRVVYEVEVLKGRSIREPQYETENYYATTGFATTIDEAARKATLYMIEYLEAVHGLSQADAYALCSLAGDLKIAEVVDIPHMLVTMHMPKDVLSVN